jgi:hypothetical protein
MKTDVGEQPLIRQGQRPNLANAPDRGHRVIAFLLAEFGDNFRVAPGSSSITANYLELGLEVVGVTRVGT